MFAYFSCFLITYSASIFASICSSIFDGKWLPKWLQNLVLVPPWSLTFSRPFPKVDSSTLRAYPPTCLYAPAIPAPPPLSRDATLSPLLDRDPWGGTQGIPREPKGIKWDPRGGQGPRAPSAPSGGMGPWGPLGLFRSHSEWKVIPEPLQMESRS